MSYTPTTWAAGDTVTATKLNNMETGIGNAVNKFIVTLTPTSLDYSGTMDKTVSEIYAAYQAGKQIVFRIITGVSTFIDVSINCVGVSQDATYPLFQAYLLNTNNSSIIWAGAGNTSEGTENTYSTIIYSLTPAT